MQQAYAPGTWKNLESQQLLFRQFCRYFRLSSLPASTRTICLYAEFLARKFNDPGTIRGYINGARVLHTLHCLDTAQFQHQCVGLVLRGIARKKRHIPQPSLPIGPHILSQIKRVLDAQSAFDRTFFCMCAFGIFLVLRKSNYMPDSIQSFDSSKQLIGEDLEFAQSSILVNFKWSKTLQFGGREHKVPLLAFPGSPICPVQAFKDMCQIVPFSPKGPLFKVKKGESWVPVTYPQFQKKLKHVLAQVGLEPAAYSSHGLRRGGASFMASCGVSKEVIKLVGDWRSDAVDKYVQLDLPTKVQAAQKVRQKVLDMS
jgi:hypothetical protein